MDARAMDIRRKRQRADASVAGSGRSAKPQPTESTVGWVVWHTPRRKYSRLVPTVEKVVDGPTPQKLQPKPGSWKRSSVPVQSNRERAPTDDPNTRKCYKTRDTRGVGCLASGLFQVGESRNRLQNR
jgi:hypothetical protein